MKYGPKLDRSAIPFLSNDRINKIYSKLRENYEKQKQEFLGEKHPDISKRKDSFHGTK